MAGITFGPDGSVHFVPVGWRLEQLPNGTSVPLPPTYTVETYLIEKKEELRRAYTQLETLEKAWNRGFAARWREIARQRITDMKSSIQGLRQVLQLPPDNTIKGVGEVIKKTPWTGRQTMIQEGAQALQRTTVELQQKPGLWTRVSQRLGQWWQTIQSSGGRMLARGGEIWRSLRRSVGNAWKSIAGMVGGFITLVRTVGIRSAIATTFAAIARGFPGGPVGVGVSLLATVVAALGLWYWTTGRAPGSMGASLAGGSLQDVCGILADLGGEASWGGSIVEHLEGTQSSYCSVEFPGTEARAASVVGVLLMDGGTGPDLACRVATLGFRPPESAASMWAPFFQEYAHSDGLSAPFYRSQPGFGSTQWYELQRSLEGVGEAGWEISEGIHGGGSPEDAIQMNYMTMFCRGPYLVFGGTLHDMVSQNPSLAEVRNAASNLREVVIRFDQQLLARGGGQP